MSRSALLTIALVGAGAAPASAIKIVGTDGRDEISVTPISAASGGTVRISPVYAYVPPAAGSSDADNCAATLAPVSGLPDEVVCRPPNGYTLTIDLGGGDDVLQGADRPHPALEFFPRVVGVGDHDRRRRGR